jgi:phosphoribosyl-ATP pyrophosphohydrolase/phosphoribosyl-AMP cyclohydrolase
VQDVDTGQVLMLAYTNAEALEASRQTGRAHFWSRSRQSLWDKGATSGQVLELVDILPDCDEDAYLYRVRAPHGACHTGSVSCFGESQVPGGALGRLFRIQESRIAHANPDASYTRRLFEAGMDRILRKVGEESAEFIVEAKNQDPARTAAEAADLLYHVLLACQAAGLTMGDLAGELRRREPNAISVASPRDRRP